MTPPEAALLKGKDLKVTKGDAPQNAAACSGPLSEFTARPQIFLATEDDRLRAEFQTYLNGFCDIQFLHSVEAVLAALEKQIPDLLFADFTNSKFFGLIPAVRAYTKHNPVFITAVLSPTTDERAPEGADDFLSRQFSRLSLLARVNGSLELKRLRGMTPLRPVFSGFEYETLLSLVPAGIYACDAAGNITFYNKKAAELWGYEPDLNQNVQKFCACFKVFLPDGTFVPPDQTPMAFAVREKKVFRNLEATVERPDGKRFQASVNIDPIVDAEGKIWGAINVFYDITDRKKAEAAMHDSESRYRNLIETLRVSEERLRLAIHAGKVGTWDWDIVNNKVTWSDQIYEFHGIQPGTFDGSLESFKKNVHPEDRERVLKAIEKSLAEFSPYSAEMRIIRPDGEVRWIATNGKVYAGADGKPVRMLGATVDITDNKTLHDEIRRSEERFRTMADASPAMLWITNPEGDCTFLSQSWYEFTGQKDSEAMGVGWNSVIHPDDLEMVQHSFRNANFKRQSFKIDHRIRRYDGEYRWFMASGRPQYGPNREFMGFIGSAVDISERKAAEDGIQQQNNDLENRVKERTLQLEYQTNRLRLLANQVSATEQRERKRIAALIHDHLQQILVAGKFQMAQAAKSIQKKQLPKAAESLSKSEELINDAIQASRSLTAELRPPVLYEDGLIAAFKWLSRKFEKEHNLKISLELDEVSADLPDGFKIMIFESVRELLFNIVKHAKVNEAKLKFKYQPGQSFYLSVSDRGAGFDLKQEEKNSNAEKGLGLFSIRERLRLLNAQCLIESQPGAGTSIEIMIPADEFIPREEKSKADKLIRDSNVPHEIEEDENVIRILLADDHKLVREGIANILKEKPKFRIVAQAENGEEAVVKTGQFFPDIVIMDVNMPRLNGIEAARLIKKQFPDVQIIGLSVQYEADVAESMRKAGASLLLNKAGDPAELIESILHCVQK